MKPTDEAKGGTLTMEASDQGALLILWTTAERETALQMVFMYAANARRHGWWPEVKLLVWGAATRALCEDESLQAGLAEVRETGVEVIACRKCAENLDRVEALKALGVKVFYTGQLLTDWLKDGKRLLAV
jgi:hypothetical protein